MTAAHSKHLVRGGTAIAIVGAVGMIASLWLTPQPAYAIGTFVPLGGAGTYSVLGGQTVTNTGPTVISGDVGVSPGPAVVGLTEDMVGGDIHVADEHALQAQADLTIAYNDAAGQAPDASIEGDLGDRTFYPGVYNASSAIGLTGTVSLDAEGDPDAVFIFQIGSTLITSSDSTVALLDGAQSCNVFWQVASSATLGTGTTFVGTIMALTSVSVLTDATVDGRALARNGSTTLDSNVFWNSACETTPTETSSEPTTEPTTEETTEPTEPPTETDTPTDTSSETETSTPEESVAPPSDTPSDGGSNPAPPADSGNPGMGSDGDRTRGDYWLPETGANGSTPLLMTAAIVTLLAGIVLVMIGRPRSRRRH